MASIGLIIFGIVVAVILLVLILWLVSRGKGKIEIQLDKYQFSPGETITGKVVLTMKKSVEANALKVGLIGEARTKQYSGGKSSTHHSRAFDFSQPIDGKKTYNPGQKSYDFSIKIPQNLLGKSGSGNQMLDTALKGAAMFLGGGMTTVTWYVTANLEMKGFDVSRKVKVNIA